MIRLNNQIKLKNITKVLGSRTFASSSSDFSSLIANSKNGIKVAALDSKKDGLMGSVSIVINAGSRFESLDNIGASHYLKAFGFRNSAKSTSFRKVREAELQGAILSSSVGRENVVYSVECFKQDIPYFLTNLSEMVTSTLYNPWEFDEINGLVHLESSIANANPQTFLTEKLHQAGFRSGLGNSIYASFPNQIEGSETVKAFSDSRIGSNTVAVVGTGIDSSELVKLVDSSVLSKLAAVNVSSSSPSKFHSGTESHTNVSGSVAHYALAFQASDPTTAALLSECLGTQSHLKWGNGTSPLSAIALKHGAQVNAFSSSYSDASIVGVMVSSSANNISEVVRLVAQAIKDMANGKISEATFGRALSSAKMRSHIATETQAGQRNALTNTVFGNSTISAQQLESASLQSALSAASTAFSVKPTVASLGSSMVIPYLDTL
ncbi:hypothetical protein BB559_001257 [Furculomyces boomerangus]|uniref:Cytochrome b-c1 complex subunit 2, mitochondrial n=2 Tax=Harpellales TaxID=61421 RepID=A0A2T9YTI8_9FUNG|nr:hypothetical protein BB559_002629 [Furculomyces boomerangus]PVU98812.1 hypothetical protein BB559_001257 [Furculomyces boomerangus]PWA01891.1 hypothetical protein BB558_002013 [Smittium angustum]